MKDRAASCLGVRDIFICDVTVSIDLLVGVIGQQAHVPVKWWSTMMYYTKFTDCGNGVMEVTWMYYNGLGDFGDDMVSYMNVPWGGIRPSVLHDYLLAPTDGGNAELIEPLFPFGSSRQFVDFGIVNLDSQGGYCIFAENAPLGAAQADPDPANFVLPCALDFCPDVWVNYTITIPYDNPCSESSGASAAWGKHLIDCYITETVDMGTQGNLYSTNVLALTNPRNESVLVDSVLRWAQNGNRLRIFPLDTTAAQANEILKGGDVITLSYYEDGKPVEDNTALAFVYGVDDDRVDGAGRSRVRAGTTGRDYTVWTVNTSPQIYPGNTYYYRQYVITDRLEDIDAQAKEFVSETHQEMYSQGIVAGRTIRLVSSDGTEFGASVQLPSVEECPGTTYCEGSTTPQVSTFPLFAVQCGTQSYVGFDQYHFAPNRTQGYDKDILRPYICDESNTALRAQWWLLGYYEEGACDALVNAEYNVDYCSPVVAAEEEVEENTVHEEHMYTRSTAKEYCDSGLSAGVVMKETDDGQIPVLTCT